MFSAQAHHSRPTVTPRLYDQSTVVDRCHVTQTLEVVTRSLDGEHVAVASGCYGKKVTTVAEVQGTCQSPLWYMSSYFPHFPLPPHSGLVRTFHVDITLESGKNAGTKDCSVDASVPSLKGVRSFRAGIWCRLLTRRSVP